MPGPFLSPATPPRGGVGRRRLLAALPLLLPAAACVSQPPARLGAIPAPALPSAQREKVGLLLPLSGQNRQLGQAMLNAAQLALFDQADPGIELLPRDTGGTAAGAAEAARAVMAQGARAIAGPLTLTETASAAQAVRSGRGASMLAFTNDASQAGGGVWVLGLTPAEQAERITAAAANAGARRFGLLAPADELGRRLATGMQTRLSALALPAAVTVLRPPRGDAAGAARELAAQAGPEGLDAVLLGESGASAKAAAAVLATAFPTPPRLLGTALWAADTAALGGEPALADAWFPAPDPAARAGFESRYMTAFGERPPRIAAVAYDAAALAGRAARFGSPPVGEAMMGADGPIRLLPGGVAQRGLAVFALDASGQQPRLVQPAPVPGAAGS